jgi:hypothetical protein
MCIPMEQLNSPARREANVPADMTENGASRVPCGGTSDGRGDPSPWTSIQLGKPSDVTIGGFGRRAFVQ